VTGQTRRQSTLDCPPHPIPIPNTVTHTSPSPQPLRHSRIINASPVYYGWVVLIVGSIGGILTSPGQTYAIAVFIDSFIEDLGVSRGMVSTLYGTGTLLGSFALPFVGRQIDKRGVRAIVGVVSLLLGVTCVYMGFIQNALMLGVGFFLLRMLGQGSLSLVSKNAINQWWVRRRGFAMGLAGVATALLGSGTFPGLINWMIPQFGWRTSYILLGVGLAVIMVPLGTLFIRNRPEDYGLQPDGHAAPDEEESAEPIEENWTLEEAIRTPVFWVISASMGSMSALSTGLTFHFFSIFRDSGLSSSMAASIFLPIASVGACVQFAGGILIDRLPVRAMVAVALVLQSTVLVMAPNLVSYEMALTMGIFMGIRGGLQLIVSSVIWAKFFGRRYLGSITGLSSTLMVGSSALGSVPFGIARDWFGSYHIVLTSFAVLPLVLAVLCLIYAKPPTQTEPSQG
jgi:sugar phosphate permease